MEKKIISRLLLNLLEIEKLFSDYLIKIDPTSLLSFSAKQKDIEKIRLVCLELTEKLFWVTEDSDALLSEISDAIADSDLKNDQKMTKRLAEILDNYILFRDTVISSVSAFNSLISEKNEKALSASVTEARKILTAAEKMKGLLNDETIYHST